MSGQHTPGPWIVHSDPKDSRWPLVMAGSSAGRIVANVNPESCPDTTSAPAFVQMPASANARLIAAVPDLLEAANAFSELARERELELGCLSPEMARVVRQTRAAIAKATGAA